MKRSKRLILLPHCVLNQNAVVRDLAREPGSLSGLVRVCLEEGLGMIQLPCPEFTYLGAERPPMDREEYNAVAFRQHCRRLFAPVLEQVTEYLARGYRIVGLVGIAASPSCGLFTTHFRSGEGPGRGVFMEEVLAALEGEGLSLPSLDVPLGYGVDAEETTAFLARFRAFCGGHS